MRLSALRGTDRKMDWEELSVKTHRHGVSFSLHIMNHMWGINSAPIRSDDNYLCTIRVWTAGRDGEKASCLKPLWTFANSAIFSLKKKVINWAWMDETVWLLWVHGGTLRCAGPVYRPFVDVIVCCSQAGMMSLWAHQSSSVETPGRLFLFFFLFCKAAKQSWCIITCRADSLRDQKQQQQQNLWSTFRFSGFAMNKHAWTEAVFVAAAPHGLSYLKMTHYFPFIIDSEYLLHAGRKQMCPIPVSRKTNLVDWTFFFFLPGQL